MVLYRVDDRLVHGQVVIGWGRPLNVKRIVLVDDTVAASDWEQDLYRMAVAEGVEITFADLATAVQQLPEWEADPRRTILLTGDLATMAALHQAHPGVVSRINLGGIHHRPGRAERLPYLYLDAEEQALISALGASGAVVTAQDLPTAVAVDATALQ
ncbi:MAG TPA: PTS sugar transporter subunit IIB [Gemmatimonadales bacterium]|nr:PTS sugar transporter subunit IIB [Gemmatimonadales bacterium]